MSASVITCTVVSESPLIDDLLQAVLDHLTERGMEVSVVREPDEATSQLIMADAGAVQCVMIDAGDVGDADAVTALLAKIRVVAAVPDVEPIVLAAGPPADLVIRAFRAGAGDFIDLAVRPGAAVVEIAERVAMKYKDRVDQRQRVRGLRTALEDFLKNLVKTERRSIDLEHALAVLEKGAEPLDQFDPRRAPIVLIVEDDREVADMLVEELEKVGLMTFAYVSGEEAVTSTVQMAQRDEPIDLALVDARLPGMNGVEAIGRMREAKPQLPAILMTGYSDPETAISAADMGVVGYVLKPFDDIPKLIRRVKERALQSMTRAREQHYLEQIKQRHEKVLLRYRKLAADLERL